MTLPFKNRIESISSTSSAPCRFTIPVTISASDDYTIETDIRWISYPDSLNIELNAYLSGNWYGVANSGFYTITPTSTTRCSTDKFDNIRFDVQGNTTTLYVNGTQAISKSNQRADITSIPLYWSTYSGSYYNMFVERKYFSLKVNGNYVHYYIPVLDNNDVPCFYDTVTNTLLYADAGYEPQVYGGVITETPSTYQRQKQLLIADKGILPYYCELEYISAPCRFEYLIPNITSNTIIETETEISLNSVLGSTQLELNGSTARWYGIDASGYYTLGNGITSPNQMPLNTWVKIRDVQNEQTATNYLYVNGNLELTRGGMWTATDLYQGMFGGVQNTTYTWNIKKKYHKVWVNGELIYDFIPVLDYDRVPCFYDRVNNNLLYAFGGNTPTVWGREIHPIERAKTNKSICVNLGSSVCESSDTIISKFIPTTDSIHILYRQRETGVSLIDFYIRLTTQSLIAQWCVTSGGQFNNQNYLEKDIVYDCVHNINGIVINNNTLTTAGGSISPNADMWLFGLPADGDKFEGWFYNLKLVSGYGKEKLNIIPVVDETGLCSLWDTVSRSYLTLTGSGALTYDDILLESIENKVITDTNTGGPFIHLPVMVKEDVEVRARLFFTDNSATRYCFGNGYCYCAHYPNNDTRFLYGNNGVTVSQTTPTIRIRKDKTKNFINDVEVTSNTENEFTANVVLSLFTSSSLKNGMVGGYNYFYFKSNGEEYNLVPTIRNGVIGMVNTIDGTMYPNLRSGVDFFPNFLPQRKMFDPYAQIDYFSITIDLRRIVNNYSYDFVNNYAGTNDNYVVDWGDGVIEKGGTSHTYAVAKDYEVKFIPLTDAFTWLRFSTGQSTKSQCLISVNKPYPKMPTTIYDVPNWFTGCTNLVSICEDFLQNNRHITNLASIFYTCSKLPAIGKNFFKGMTKLRALSYAFRDTKLAKIPAGLLDDCNDLRIVEHMFANTPITSIPAGLFDNISKSSTMSFAVIFFGTNITSVPQGLFDGFTNVTSISRIFNNCQQLETLPDLLFKDMRNLKNISYAFTYCNALQFNANLFCNEATDMATHFTNSDLDFSGAFNRTTWTGTTQGTAPQLWNYTISGTPTTTGCFGGAGNNATSLTNYSSIPNAWGGPA